LLRSGGERGGVDEKRLAPAGECAGHPSQAQVPSTSGCMVRQSGTQN
jgi:hypothetical protein